MSHAIRIYPRILATCTDKYHWTGLGQFGKYVSVGQQRKSALGLVMVIFINTSTKVTNDAKRERDENMNYGKCKIEGVGEKH